MLWAHVGKMELVTYTRGHIRRCRDVDTAQPAKGMPLQHFPPRVAVAVMKKRAISWHLPPVTVLSIICGVEHARYCSAHYTATHNCAQAWERHDTRSERFTSEAA